MPKKYLKRLINTRRINNTQEIQQQTSQLQKQPLQQEINKMRDYISDSYNDHEINIKQEKIIEEIV